MISVQTIILSLIVIPVAFIMLVWAWAMVQRILTKDAEPPLLIPHDRNPTSSLNIQEPVPVGFREIRELSKKKVERQMAEYHYAWGHSEGLPMEWIEDLQERRN
jgi:hypothetical protein